jgi:radical SAM superfamily enzyme YgiQ (UPF0313 family)
VLCFYGLYAALNRDWLLERHADAVLGGEAEEQLVALAGSLERGQRPHSPPPGLRRLEFPVPSRAGPGTW